MNYSTDVKFNNNLVKNGKTTISYSGSLFRTGSEAVTIVYGFGDNWENTTEKEMTKNENNFSVEIELLDFDKLNFCFRNSNNIWDNNNYLNYTAPIVEPEKEYNFIINENLVPEMLDNLLQNDLSSIKSENISKIETEQITENQVKENVELVESSVISEEYFEIEISDDDNVDIQDFIGEVQEDLTITSDLEQAFSTSNESQNDKKEEIVNFDMDSLIDEILTPVIEAKIEDSSNQESSINIDDIEIEDSFLEEVNNDENIKIQNVVAEEPVEVKTQDIQAENIVTNAQDIQAENAESGNDENGNIVSNELFENDDGDSILKNLSSENSLIEVKEFGNSFIVSPRSLNKFYIFKKRIKLAVYKLFTAIPKIIDSAFNTEKD